MVMIRTLGRETRRQPEHTMMRTTIARVSLRPMENVDTNNFESERKWNMMIAVQTSPQSSLQETGMKKIILAAALLLSSQVVLGDISLTDRASMMRLMTRNPSARLMPLLRQVDPEPQTLNKLKKDAKRARLQ